MSKKRPPPAKRKPNAGWNLPYMPYFTHEALVHNWPPGWLPSDDWGQSAVNASQQASEQRDIRQARGITDTIVGLSNASDDRAKSTRAAEWLKSGVA